MNIAAALFVLLGLVGLAGCRPAVEVDREPAATHLPTLPPTTAYACRTTSREELAKASAFVPTWAIGAPISRLVLAGMTNVGAIGGNGGCEIWKYQSWYYKVQYEPDKTIYSIEGPFEDHP